MSHSSGSPRVLGTAGRSTWLRHAYYKELRSLTANCDQLFQAAVIHPAVAETGRVQAPGLARRTKVVDGQQRFFIQHLRVGIDNIGDAQHRREINPAADRNRTAPECRNLPAVRLRAIFSRDIVPIDVFSLRVYRDPVDLFVGLAGPANHRDRYFEVFDLAGLHIHAGN